MNAYCYFLLKRIWNISMKSDIYCRSRRELDKFEIRFTLFAILCICGTYIYTQQKKIRKSQKTMYFKNTKANNYPIFI